MEQQSVYFIEAISEVSTPETSVNTLHKKLRFLQKYVVKFQSTEHNSHDLQDKNTFNRIRRQLNMLIKI